MADPIKFDPDEFMSKRQGSAPASSGAFDPDAFMSQRKSSVAPPLSLVPGTEGSGPAERFVSNFAGAINPVPGIKQMVNEAADPNIGIRATLGRHFIDPQFEQFQKAGQAATGKGEFEHMSVPGRISSAVGHGAAGMLPLVGPAAANAGDQIGSGDVAGGLGSGAGLITSIAAPDIIRSVGKGMMGTAEPIAENALGIRNIDRKFGRNPGRAVLDETTSVRPELVSKQAGEAINSKAALRDSLLANSPNKVDISPAISEGKSAIARAAAGNSEIGHLQPMIEQLTQPRQGFTGATQPTMVPPSGIGPTGPPEIAPLQPPLDALSMRQRFGNDFTKFDAARPLTNEARTVGNRMYGKLTGAIHSAVPESAALDSGISDLIPVRDSAAVRQLEPGLAGSSLRRIAARTGGLAAGTLLGSAVGNPTMGALMGAVAPEFVSNPTIQMIGARGLDYGGKVLSHPVVSPGMSIAPTAMPVGRLIQAAPLVKERENGSQ